jgi:hypothetical protein
MINESIYLGECEQCRCCCCGGFTRFSTIFFTYFCCIILIQNNNKKIDKNLNKKRKREKQQGVLRSILSPPHIRGTTLRENKLENVKCPYMIDREKNVLLEKRCVC